MKNIRFLSTHVRVVFAITLFAMFSGCSKYPLAVQAALEKAGNNRSQLSKVLEHYADNPGDSLKFKAACFLIANMPGRYYYEGELLDHFYEFIARVDQSPALLDSIRKVHGAYSPGRLQLKYDIEEINAKFLIDNIDWAFKVRDMQPWGRNISFDQFCKYILPYRNGDEVPDYNRAAFFEQFNHVLDSVRSREGGILQACHAVNNALKKEGWAFTTEGGFLPHFSAQKLLTQKKGNCRDMVSKTIFVMRALGIPVTSEFTPNWGNRSGGHLWNVVIDEQGIHHPFMGTENNSSRELHGGVHYTLSKVYRNTVQRQTTPEFLSRLTNNDYPELFKNPFIKDVTAGIGKSINIQISLKNIQPETCRVAYLCVFDNTDWVPVAWGKINNKHASFNHIVKGVIYLPVFFSKGVLTPANDPFMVTNEIRLRISHPATACRT